MKSVFYRLVAKLRQISEIVLACILTQDNWFSLEKCDVLLVCHDNDRGYVYKNQAYSQLLDSLGDLLKQKGLIVETIATPFSKITKLQGYNEPKVFNRIALAITLKAKFIKFIRRPNKSLYWLEKQQKILWKKILVYSQTKVVISIQPDVALCRAAHAQKILVYDLQHGVINDQNYWYSKKFRQYIDDQDIPHGFLCWDQLSADTLTKWTNQKKITVEIVGNPWFRRFIEPDIEDSLVKEALKIQPVLRNQRPTILISLQWGMVQFFGEYVPNGVIPQALEETILKTANLYNWLIRLHPVQMRGTESLMVQQYLDKSFGHLDTVEWKQCSNVALPVVLKWSNLHITYNSSTVTEAAWMGLYTGLLDPEIRPDGKASQYYTYEISRGIAQTLPLNSIVITEWIKSTLIKGKAISTLDQNKLELDSFIERIVNYCQN